MGDPSAIVVGGGVGGCAAALALQRVGWSVTVLERRPAGHQAAGSGISLWPNALRALETLGLAGIVRSGAVLGGRSGIRAVDGRWVAHTDLAAAIQRRFGLPLVLVRRERLLTALVDALGAERIEHAATVTEVETGPGYGRVRVGEHQRGADLVVVADGARSTLRGAVLREEPAVRYAGYTSWRFITGRPRGDLEPSETWGPNGQRFAILPVDDKDVYCYATANARPGVRRDDERNELRERFGTWHDPIPAVLHQLGPDDVIRTDIIDLSPAPTTLHRDRLVLLGDAAHAMTPDLGQGGCQALEDAVTLARLAPAGANLDDALDAYSTARGPRGADLVRRSRRSGQLYQAPPWLSLTIARVTGRLPASILVRALAPVLDWQPPSVEALRS